MPRSHVTRTNSEVQLREDMAAAEWRDLCMFYRVVHGIRERQNSSPDGAAIDGSSAAEIANTAIERIALARQQDCSEEMESTVTPYDSLSESSPHTQGYRQRAEGYLNQHAVIPASEADGWSISGYEETASHYPPVAIVEADEAFEEDGVFSMEL